MKIPFITTISIAALLLPSPVNARPQECGTSFMILPNRECLNLDYIKISSDNLERVQRVNELYGQLIRGNAAFESNPLNRLAETKEEKEGRMTNLVQSTKSRDSVVKSGKNIEDLSYQLHQLSMAKVRRAFVLKR